MNAPLASRAAAWNSNTRPKTLPNAVATQKYSGGSKSQGTPATRGTSSSPVTAMPWITPMPTASWVFQGSCPRPGRTKAGAIHTSAAGASGSFRSGGMPPLRSGFLRLGVAALELLDAAGGVQDLGLAGVVRGRLGRHLDLDH